MFVWSRTIGDDCFIARQLANAIRNLSYRNQLSTGDMAQIEGRLIANIDEIGLSARRQSLRLLHINTARVVRRTWRHRINFVRDCRAGPRSGF